MSIKISKRILVAALAFAVLGSFAAVASAGHHDAGYKAEKDIVGIATSSDDFSTLVTALKAAGLVEALQGDGPLTVFAPTNEAFAKLPAGTLESLLADKDALTAVLTYHVVSGKVTAKDVMKLDSATTLQGGALAIDTSDGVKVGSASVVKADVMASNGVVHVIDTVLIPAE
jgi:uncharacterized surface protein with fasciclin (FAS1) repeats